MLYLSPIITFQYSYLFTTASYRGQLMTSQSMGGQSGMHHEATLSFAASKMLFA